MTKVSVIMPSFNVAKYIERCLLSVISQTLKDIEIIVVDKYSTDGTREIIERYAREDHRIKLLNDDRGSCGYSDNIGIDAATGKYIGIVETDDYIEPDMYEILYEIAEKEQVDYVKSDCYEFISDMEGNEITRTYHMLGCNSFNLYNERINVKEHPEILNYIRSMWASLYKKEFLVKNNIRFNESKGAAYQDHGFLWQIVTKADTAMYIDRKFYHYRLDNVSCSMNNPKALYMDWGELQFIRNYLISNHIFKTDYDRLYYKKVYDILEIRLTQYFYGKGVKESELNRIIESYRQELLDGIKNGSFSLNFLEQSVYEDITVLLESADGYAKRIQLKAEKLRNHVIGQLGCIGKRNNVIFGCGDNGLNLYWILTKNHLENKILAFCDNDVKKQGMDHLNKKVLAPEEAIRKYPNAAFIIANARYYNDIRRQLLKLGVSNDRIIIFQHKINEV